MNSEFQILSHQTQVDVPVTVFRVRGWLDAQSEEQLLEAARAAYDGGARYLLIDMSELDTLTSAGMRAQATGTPQAIASSTGMPNPSKSDGNTTARAARYNAGRSSAATNPGSWSSSGFSPAACASAATLRRSPDSRPVHTTGTVTPAS